MLDRRALVVVPCVVLIAGCFGKVREDTIPAPAPPPAPTSTVPPHHPQPPPEPPEPPDPPDPYECIGSTPIDASSLPWAPPAAPQNGACTTADVDALRQYIDDGQYATMQDIVDFVKKRSATCSSCIFTDANAGTWGPIPLVDGDAETVNVGACWGLVSGDASCGKAAQNEQDCTYEACTDCSDTASFEQCQQASLKGPCASEAAAFQKSCAAVITNAPSSCTDFYDSIRVQCVSGP